MASKEESHPCCSSPRFSGERLLGHLFPGLLVTGPFRRNLIAKMREHEKANGRGQIAVLASRIDRFDDLGQRHAARSRNLLKGFPERIFETHAGLMTTDDYRALDDRRFHFFSPVARRV